MTNSPRLLINATLGIFLAAFLFIFTTPNVQAAEAAPQWEACGWGGGGFFVTCAYHPTNSNVMYLGGDVSGIFKSVDKGKNWKFINKGIADYGIYAMAISTNNPDVLYIGGESGICKTTDGGENWTYLEKTGPKNLKILANRSSVRPIAVDPSNADIVYAGSLEGKIYKSEDGGQNWNEVYDGYEPSNNKDANVISSVVIAATNPKLIFAAGKACGVLRSEDAGATWKQVSKPKASMSVAVASYDEKTVYAAFNDGGLMKSTDKGETWSPVPGKVPEGYAIREIALHPKNPNVINCIAIKGWGGVFLRTADGGKTWESVSQMKKNLEGNPTLPLDGAAGMRALSSVSNLALNPTNPDELFISANWSNAFSSDGGKTWENRDGGADITCCTDLQFSGNRTYATAMDEGLFVTENGGKLWKQLFPLKYAADQSGHQWRVCVIKQGKQDKLVSTLEPWNVKTPAARVLISEDGGATFQVTTKGMPEKKSSREVMWGHSIPRALAVDPKNPKVLYLGIDGEPEPDKGVEGGGIFKSIDGGTTWERLPNQPDSRQVFNGLAVCPTDSNRIYWATCGKRGGLYRTEDAGKTWSKILSNGILFNMAVSPAGVVYAGQHNLWKSADHGNTWEQVTDFKTKLDIVGIEIDPTNEKRVWVARRIWSNASTGDVWRTTDGGTTWEDITGNLPVRHSMVLRYNPQTKELWTGSFSGIFKIKQ